MSNQQPISTFPGIAVAVALCLTAAAHGGTRFVAPPPCGDDSQMGFTTTCFNIDGPKATIQAAIDASFPGDVVIVAQGEYFENINFNGKAITVRSTDPNDAGVVLNTIINGGGAGSVVTCSSGEGADTVLSGFVITGGNATNGGGMFNSGSSPTVTNCSFSGNSTANFGGGMFNGAGSSPTVTNCTFSGNTASRGGGMRNELSSPTVTNCSFIGNVATTLGGGMFNDNNSNPTVTNCTFSGNSATNNGGGMFNQQSSPTVTNCTFSGNTAGGSGGGMVNSGGSPTVTNCSFIGNSALLVDGGGMLNISNATVTNCTFSGNSATGIGGRGGGMFNTGGINPTLTNTGFCDNTPDQIDGPFNDFGGNSLLYCAPPRPPCPTDSNGDGATNVLDLVQLLLAFGTTCP